MDIYYYLRIGVLMSLIIILGSASHISLPLVVSTYPSVFFVIIMCSIQGILIYGFSLLAFRIYLKKRYGEYYVDSIVLFLYEAFLRDVTNIKTHWKTIALVGISNALMCYLMMYSANPIRTPVVIQSVFLGLAILSSIAFSKAFVNKIVEYNWPCAIISILFLTGSVGIAIIPLINDSESDFHLLWIFMFLFGVFAYSLTNVLQEKYIIDTNDLEFNNKLHLAFYSSIVQFAMVITLSWLDLLIGYKSAINSSSFDLFVQSFKTMVTDPIAFVVLEIFIILWFILFMLAVFLNEISTNYTMILTNITNQSVALFFIIFPHLNHGIKYPWYVTAGSLGTSFVSVLFWIQAEKNIAPPDESIVMDDVETDQ